MQINFDITQSQEIDCKPRKEEKRIPKEEYDYEDSLVECEDDGGGRVETEPFIQNFFIYAGELPDCPKRVLKKFNAYEKHKFAKALKENEEHPHKYTIRDEFRIKNEIILRNGSISGEDGVFEFLVNSLVIDDIENVRIVLNKLNVKESRIVDEAYLKEKLMELNAELENEEKKLVELLDNGMGDVFLEQLTVCVIIFIRSLYLDIFIERKRRMSDKTIKKWVKTRFDRLLRDATEEIKNWPIKLHHYKKRTFFNENSHYLNSTLTRSDIFDSVDKT